jgi:CSLREA domain-containing protein
MSSSVRPAISGRNALALDEAPPSQRGAKVIKEMIQPTATRRRSLWWALLALLVLGGVVVLAALSSDRAEAAITFTVNSTGDQGEPAASRGDGLCDWDAATNGPQCTLRAAIQEANTTSGADTIEFNIGGTGGLKTISPSTALPIITEALTIDGYTQTGARPNSLAEGNDALINVQLDGVNAGSVVPGLRIDASDTTIKGLILRRFSDFGIVIYGLGGEGNTVEGNFIGVNRDGITDRGNSDGVFIEGESNTVGGTEPEMRNVISGNGGSGVVVSSEVATENRIEGNFIGTTADGTGNLGNSQDGVTIQNGTDLNAIGGTLQGAPNRIAHNGGDGVEISSFGLNESEGNHVLSNSIYNNDELGIDLIGGSENANGVTANDSNDTDTGPNNLQNFPVITSATRSNSTTLTTISGRLYSDPSQDYVIQCYLTNSGAASSQVRAYAFWTRR